MLMAGDTHGRPAACRSEWVLAGPVQLAARTGRDDSGDRRDNRLFRLGTLGGHDDRPDVPSGLVPNVGLAHFVGDDLARRNRTGCDSTVDAVFPSEPWWVKL